MLLCMKVVQKVWSMIHQSNIIYYVYLSSKINYTIIMWWFLLRVLFIPIFATRIHLQLHDNKIRIDELVTKLEIVSVTSFAFVQIEKRK